MDCELSKEEVIQWLSERKAYYQRIAASKEGDDQQRWLEDAAYFSEAINLIEADIW